MVVLNQQPAPRRARRDDLVGLPSHSLFTAVFGPIEVGACGMSARKPSR